ncbi:hypothetical protein Lal_00003525 [Lupinus albus]|uniref:Putative HSP20-like chaperone n=1 Tax=Lupinus albus TaxID=3870 RepID=A0A6A5MBH5_LUPAL|nr:putative HSP20-like chaperone [Lupinus albus]KAF1870319.1 hypothetical protein Lal_00003525 [Lupinus albus]
MAHTVSSSYISFNLPLSSKGSSAYFCLSRPIQSSKLMKFKPIRSMAGDPRETLDHMPRQNKHHSQPKRRVAPAASIGLWDRFPTARTVQEMMETMERMMEEPIAMNTNEWPSSSPVPNEGVGGYRRKGRTAWEIKEGDGEYKMRFDMPGMNKEDVKVWVEEKMLVVKAEKVQKNNNTLQQKEEEEEEEENNNEEEELEEWSAKSYGRYSGRITLPENVQFEKIKAKVKDGVLYITIPKATSYSNVLDICVQ